MQRFALLIGVLLLGLAGCSEPTDLTGPNKRAPAPAMADSAPSIELNFGLRPNAAAATALSGGATTVFDATANAFSLPAANLAGARLDRHLAGDDGFETEFESTAGSLHPGLGPVFDNISCEACHALDGRGRPPTGAESFESLLFRASVAGPGPNGGPRPVPGFGLQLQLRSIAGVQPDAAAVLSYVTRTGTFADGSAFSLQVPTFSLTGVRQPLPLGTLVSPRVAPVVFGLGLLEAVPEGLILAIAATQRLQGISGRPNYVWDEAQHRVALGRFGWKANAPNLLQQTAGAYNGDMGITSSLFPAEACEGADPACARHTPEVNDSIVADVAFYTRTLAVPARRNVTDPTNRQGEALFYRSGCASCHIPTLVTGVLPGVPEVSNQVIHPYTDLLVHDMGPGLADNRPDFRASGREWRTPPLWGIGLVETVNGHTNFLHDGRARSLEEAVLWHGGEATVAQARFRALSATDRAALIAFLLSL